MPSLSDDDGHVLMIIKPAPMQAVTIAHTQYALLRQIISSLSMAEHLNLDLTLKADQLWSHHHILKIARHAGYNLQQTTKL